jgi:hypothetical protein
MYHFDDTGKKLASAGYGVGYHRQSYPLLLVLHSLRSIFWCQTTPASHYAYESQKVERTDELRLVFVVRPGGQG